MIYEVYINQNLKFGLWAIIVCFNVSKYQKRLLCSPFKQYNRHSCVLCKFWTIGNAHFCDFMQIMPFPSVQIYSASVLSILVKDIQNWLIGGKKGNAVIRLFFTLFRKSNFLKKVAKMCIPNFLHWGIWSEVKLVFCRIEICPKRMPVELLNELH